MKQVNILFIGTIPPPYTGQAIAFEAAYLHMSGRNYIINQNYEDKGTFIKSLLLLLSFLKIWYFLVFKKIDIVYFACSRTTLGSLKDLFLVFSAKFFGLKIVNHLHGARMKAFMESLPKFYRTIVLKLYDNIDISIVLLESMKEEFHQFWPRMDVRVVPNFYTTEFDTIQKKKPHTHLTLVYLSNIIYSKGILDLIDAFSMLMIHDSDVELIIAGDFIGDSYYSREEIRKLFFEKIEGCEQITFTGVISGKTKVDLLAKTDIFVLPTFYAMEAFPLSIIEAMRSGNVIITTEHNYLGEIIQPKMGYLIPKNCPKELYTILKTLVNSVQSVQSVQQYNMQYAKEYFSLKQYILKLENIMKDVVEQ